MKARLAHAAAWLVPVAALALSDAARAWHEPVPVVEAGRLSPEQLRSLLSGRVQVLERLTGSVEGILLVRIFSKDGRWTGCIVRRGKDKGWIHGGPWTVDADSRGRGKLFAVRPHKKPEHHHHINPAVIHYDPDTGRFLWRTWPVGPDRPIDIPTEDKVWVDWNEGWLQEKWPQSAVDKCPDLDLGGLAVDGRQTGETLGELRRQTPKSPLRGLVELQPPVPRKAQ